MNNVLKFLAKLLLFSLLLFMAREVIFLAYQFCVMVSYKLLGLRFPANTLPYDSSERLIPFIALVLATARIGWKRRFATIMIGCAAFLLMDLSGIILWQTPPTFQGTDESAFQRIHYLVWELGGHWLLPLVIWIVAAKEEIVRMLEGIVPSRSGSAS